MEEEYHQQRHQQVLDIPQKVGKEDIISHLDVDPIQKAGPLSVPSDGVAMGGEGELTASHLPHQQPAVLNASEVVSECNRANHGGRTGETMAKSTSISEEPTPSTADMSAGPTTMTTTEDVQRMETNTSGSASGSGSATTTRPRRESKGGRNSQLPFWMRSDRWPSIAIGTPSLRQAATNGNGTLQRVSATPPSIVAKTDDTNPIRATESTFASLLQPILALFPPQQVPAPLLPTATIDLNDPIESKPAAPNGDVSASTKPSTRTNTNTNDNNDATGYSSTSYASSEPFVIHRPATFKPVKPRTAARLAYAFDWRIDVFGDSPNEVKGQRTKYPKPVLPPIPPSEPLEFSLEPNTAKSSSSSHHHPYSHPRRSPSNASLRPSSVRKEKSRGSLLMMSRAVENIRRAGAGAVGMRMGAAAGVGAGVGVGGRARSGSTVTSLSCLSNVSLPSFVSGMSGSEDHHERELITPFGSEVAIDERMLLLQQYQQQHHLLVRQQREEGVVAIPIDGEGDRMMGPPPPMLSSNDVFSPSSSSQPRDALMMTIMENCSPTAPLREGMTKMGLVTPPLAKPMPYIPFSEPVGIEREMFAHVEAEIEKAVMGEEVERPLYTPGMTPFTPLTPRSVPSDESDDDDDDDDED